MKKIVPFIILAVLVSGCVSCRPERSEDGYSLFSKVCQHHASLNVEWNDPVWDDLLSFKAEGGDPTTNIVALLEKESRAFGLVPKMKKARTWEPPDIRKISASTKFPNLVPWRGFNRVATAKAILELQNGNTRECLDFLAILNDVGMKLSKSGVLMHVLAHIGSRCMQYPVLASTIDALPVEDLDEYLVVAKKQYEQIPTMQECLRGEQFMAINTASDLFADLRKQLQDARLKMIQDLEKHGVAKDITAKIKTEEALSVSQWETQALANLRGLQSFFLEKMETASIPELYRLDSEIEKRVDNIGTTTNFEAVLATWETFMTNQVSDTFSLTDAVKLHSLVGGAISQKLSGMLMPATGRFGVKYREYVAYERLVLVRIASRIYMTKHGDYPHTLQQLVDTELLGIDLITDPLCGSPFLVRKDGGTFIVYSVGRDLHDDNGHPWNNRDESGDVILVPLKKGGSGRQVKSSIR